MNDGCERKVGTEHTEYEYHTGIGATTVTTGSESRIPKPPTHPDDILPLTLQTTHTLLQDIQGNPQLHRQGTKFPAEKPYVNYDFRGYHCSPVGTYLITRPVIKPPGLRQAVKTIWNRIFYKR